MNKETNPSRQIKPNDRWSEEAKKRSEYWLCECGIARSSVDRLVNHLDKEQHTAERITKQYGKPTVTAIIKSGYEYNKYDKEPNTAFIDRYEFMKHYSR